MMSKMSIESIQAETMLHLQDEINSKINKLWREEKNCWYRAIWTECAEMMDHVGWKWWKSEEVNEFQMKLELVDIWHFGLSEILTTSKNVSEASLLVAETLKKLDSSATVQDKAKLLLAIEDFSFETLKSKAFHLDSFVKLAKISGLDKNQLYRSYVGKNVLNSFRQDKGYKTGGYIKVWNGKEDNVWLNEAMNNISIASTTFSVELYSELENLYNHKR